ncbi:MAG TPA: site-specific integrase, partial [Roseiflexaceae bacterium]|nr:site-specific integrase [Roseiflexaceae bacterium]
TECHKLIQAAASPRLALIYKTLIATGMRESELIGLQWRMIDWEHGQINLTSQLKWLRDEKRWERLPLKNRKRRLIPLDATLIDELRAHQNRQHTEQYTAGDTWQDNDLVFATASGAPYIGRNLINYLQRDTGVAKIGKITVHELRHTAGSLLLQAGKTMTTVSKILGHSSVGVTDKIYRMRSMRTSARRYRRSPDCYRQCPKRRPIEQKPHKPSVATKTRNLGDRDSAF